MEIEAYVRNSQIVAYLLYCIVWYICWMYIVFIYMFGTNSIENATELNKHQLNRIESNEEKKKTYWFPNNDYKRKMS